MGKQKSAFVAIIGRPNAGKSSIMNRLLGQKVVIVSDKPQTTRTRVMGVLTVGDNQYVFVDTPGFHKPRTVLGENMVKAVGDGMSDVELCLLIVDAEKKPSEIEKELCKKLKKGKQPAILVINKIDLIKEKTDLLSVILEYNKLYDFAAVVPVSAKNGDGFDGLMEEIDKFAEDGIHMFDEDTLTDQPERVLAAEFIREKLLRTLDKEIPHGTAVVIERFKDRDDGILDIDATIFCEKKDTQGHYNGKGGETLKRVGTLARRDMENFFGCKVNLNCWVKVREGWRNQRAAIHNFGLD
mgnify:FL=1